LDVLGVVVATTDDDEVLGATTDVEAATSQIAKVAGVQPSLAQNRSSLLVVFEIALHHRRAPDDDFADSPLGKGRSVGSRDLERVPRRAPAAAHTSARSGPTAARVCRER